MAAGELVCQRGYTLKVAEEVGVEPTRRCVSTSLVLKTRHPTGDVALPSFYSLSRLRIAFGFAIVRSLPCRRV
jgi:hypothetical protein